MLIIVFVLFSAVQIRRNRMAAYLDQSDLIATYSLNTIDSSSGIYEYAGKRLIIGGGNLVERKKLIDSLQLLDLPPDFEIDLRFKNQIILKKIE
ncbi:MAG: hypothetical protein ABIL05_00820 [candidate division WOR-3 bacterium]